MLTWFRFDPNDYVQVQERLFDLGYGWHAGPRQAQEARRLKPREVLLLTPNKNLLTTPFIPAGSMQMDIHYVLNLPHTTDSHYTFETADGKLTSIRNPDYKIVAITQFHDETTYYVGDVCPADMSIVSMETETQVWRAPCRCPSLLQGHEKHCAWAPLPPEEERERAAERERLENVWGILQPRESPSYKTASDCAATYTFPINRFPSLAELIKQLSRQAAPRKALSCDLYD